MSKTYKHKTFHIYDLVEKGLRKLPLKLKWSHINKVNRHNLDWDIDRKELSLKREKIIEKDFKNQIKEFNL